MEALETDHHDTFAVLEAVCGNGDIGLRIHQRNEVGGGSQDLAVHRGGQVLILELHIGGMALVLTDALQHDLAEVEAGPGLPQHIRDLALKELEALGHFKEMLLRRLVTAVLDSADGLAQLLAAGDDAVDAKFLHLFAAHGIKRHGDGSAAAHGDRPGQLLRPFVGDGLKDAAVALLVHQRHRRCLDTADGKGHHLQFREGTAHAVHIHHRHIQPGRRSDGQHGVDAAGLDGHKGVDLPAEELGDHIKELFVFVAADGLLRQYRRRAHHGDGDNKGVIRHLLRVQQRDRAALLYGADGHQLAYIGITATTGAQQRRTGGNIFDLRDSDFSHDLFLLSL